MLRVFRAREFSLHLFYSEPCCACCTYLGLHFVALIVCDRHRGMGGEEPHAPAEGEGFAEVHVRKKSVSGERFSLFGTRKRTPLTLLS